MILYRGAAKDKNMDYKISVLKIIHDTIVDGIGLRTSVYCAGCDYKCRNCHNPESWDINNGTWLPIQDIYNEIIRNPITSVTFTGGDPMYQADSFCELAKLIKNNTAKNIWCYTGDLFEDIVSKKDSKYELLQQVDYLVDGRYIDELRKLNLPFRGSSNQRIINVQESLKRGEIVC